MTTVYLQGLLQTTAMVSPAGVANSATSKGPKFSLTQPPIIQVGPTLKLLSLSTSAINENSPAGTVVGQILNTTTGSTVTMGPGADGGGRFTVSNISGGWYVVTTAVSTDYETATSHSIDLVETLSGAIGNPKTTSGLTIGVINQNDTNPNAFAFVDVTNASQGTLETSNSITIAGLGASDSATASISGDASSQMSVNGGAWGAGPATVVNGDTIAVRHTSSASTNATVSTTLTVGTTTDTFSSTTSATAALFYDTRFGTDDATTIIANGGLWTFALNAGRRRVWADSINGNDANDGLSYSTPKKTLLAAEALLIAGAASDQLMIAGGQGQTYIDPASSGKTLYNLPGGGSAIYPTATLCYDSTDPTNAAKYGKLRGAKKPKVSVHNSATFTGYIDNGAGAAGSTLTVTDAPSPIYTGMGVTGVGVAQYTTILSQLSGTPNGAGTYHVSVSQLTPSTTLRGQTGSFWDLPGDGGGTSHNYVVQGIDFVCNDGAANAEIRFVGYHKNIGFQNCRFNGVAITADNAGSSYGLGSCWGVSQCSFTGMWDDIRGDASAVYSSGNDQFYLQDSAFVHCGYKLNASRDDASSNGGASVYGHSLYLHSDPNVHVREDRLFFMDSESDDWGMRCNGIGTQLVSIDQAAGQCLTGFSGSYTEAPGGTTGGVDDFLLTGGQNTYTGHNTYGGGVGVANTQPSGTYVNNGYLFDNPYKANSQLIVVNASGGTQVAQAIAVSNLRVWNYATSKSLDLYPSTNGATATFSDCLLDSLVANINNAPTTPLGGTNRLWTAGDYPAPITKAQLISGLGFSTKADLANAVLTYPYLAWARAALGLAQTAFGGTLKYPTAAVPDISGLPAPDVVYRTTLGNLTFASSLVRQATPTISSATSSVNTCVITTATPHGLSTGQMVQTTGFTPSAYNSNGVVPIRVISATQFSYRAPNIPGGNATVIGTYQQGTTLVGTGVNSTFTSTDLPAGFTLKGTTILYDGSGSGAFPQFHIKETNSDGAGEHTTTFFPAAAPTLSSATAAQTGATTATLGVTSDTASGLWHVVLCTTNVQPTAAQIAAGEDSTGAALPAAQVYSQSVTTLGAQSLNASGLTTGQIYYPFYVQDVSGVYSNVLPAPSFTPANWTPASDPNLAWDFTRISPANMWQDTAGTTQVTADLQTVKRYKDPTTGIIWTNPTGWVYHANSGQPYLQMDGASIFVSTTNVTIGDASGQHTTFATINLPNTTTSQSVVDMDNFNGAGRVSQILRVSSGTDQSIAFNTSGTAFTGTGPAVSINTKHVLSEITQTTQVQAFVDGTAGSATPVTGTLSKSYGTLNIGGRNPGAANQFATGPFFGAFGVKGVMGSTSLSSAETYMAAL